MKIKKFGWFIILALCLNLTTVKLLFAEGSNNIELSYKMIESNSDDQNLIMTVRLKAKNTSSLPIYGVIARINYMDKVLINTNEIYLGDINAGETALSSDIFIITIDIASADQEPPQIEIVWSVEYNNANGNLLVEYIALN